MLSASLAAILKQMGLICRGQRLLRVACCGRAAAWKGRGGHEMEANGVPLPVAYVRCFIELTACFIVCR